MKISCNILKKHIKNSEDIDFLKVWDKFTIRTAEVESVEVKGKNIDGVITAKIIECENHPESKKLHILKVDTGKEIKQIVCGAPNVRVGLIGALIEVGGHIDDIEIGVRPLVGVDSYGMMCSGRELGISDNHDGIIELPDDTPIGINIKEIIPMEDIIVDIDNKSLTHRPDLWGHYGIAREICAITNHELNPLDLFEENVNNQEDMNIKINNPELCFRYIGTKIDNIENKKTPLWMQTFLYYAGMRSINLIVDLTNYIMLELGQPMHAFDSKIVNNIEVGLANDNEEFTTLDGISHKLTKDDLMIKNGDNYFALAGIMGGQNSEIEEETNNIVLESATFLASTVRKSAIRLGLRTEASARYEKSLDPNLAMLAVKRFIKLLKNENPNIKLGSNITDIYPNVQKENVINLSKEYLYKYMGFNISDQEVINILTSLEFKVENKEDKFIVTVPTFRSTKDITIEADIIEEISRMYGYENFENIPLKMDLTFNSEYSTYDFEYDVKNYLASKYNFNEIHTYLWHKTSFLKKLNLEIDNTELLGKKEDNILRNDLNLSMLEYSIPNLKNYASLNIFEIGTVIEKNNVNRRLSMLLVDNIDKIEDTYYKAKDIVLNLFKELKNININFVLSSKEEANYNNRYTLDITDNSKYYGWIKILSDSIRNNINKKRCFVFIDLDFDVLDDTLVNKVQYKETSKYPLTTLDYTIIMDNNKKYNELDTILDAYENSLIINRTLIDKYKDNNKNKYTIRYLVGSLTKTLESSELDNFKQSFIKHIKDNNLEIIEN